MSLHLKKIGFGTLVALLIAGICLVSFFAVYMVTITSKTAADYLPADSTIVLVEHPTTELIMSMSRWGLPGAYTADLPTDTEAIAFVDTPSGPNTLLFFTHQSINESILRDTPSREAGRFVVVSLYQESIPSVDTDVLSAVPAYRSLARQRDRRSSWAYLDLTKFPTPPEPRSFLDEAFLAHATKLVLEETATQSRVHTYYEEGAPEWAPLSLPLQGMLDDPVVQLSVADLPSVLQSLEGRVPLDVSLLTEAIFSNWTRDTLGVQADLEQDILPLLRDTLTLELAPTASGSLAFAAYGSVPFSYEPTTVMHDIHERYAATLPAVRHRTYLFDEEFSFENLVYDESAIVHEEENHAGWTVTVTRQADTGEGLLGAIRGREFFLTNDLSTQDAIARGDTPQTAAVAGSAVARGMFDSTRLRTDLDESAWSRLLPSDSLLFPANLGVVRWTLQQQDGVVTVSVDTTVQPGDVIGSDLE